MIIAQVHLRGPPKVLLRNPQAVHAARRHADDEPGRDRHRRGVAVKHIHLRTLPTGLLLAILATQATEAAGPNGGGKPGGGGTKSPPNPDIIYMSDDSSTDAVWQASVRGIEIADSNGTLSLKDVSLNRSKAGRQPQSVAWSPDGRLAAWFELGNGMVSTPISIIVAAPGKKPVAVYTATSSGSPGPVYGEDVLAWGQDCAAGSRSILAFAGTLPVAAGSREIHWGIFAIRFDGGVPEAVPVQLWDYHVTVGAEDFHSRYLPGAFAFAPDGPTLAFAGTVEDTPGDPVYGAWRLDTCTGDVSAIRERPGFHVHSMDWDRHAQHDRLALAVTNAASPDWRNLMILDLNDRSGASDRLIELFTGDPGYEGYSSEHSPQWGPATSDGCERLAFSRSWWDPNPDLGTFHRSLYLFDVDGTGQPSCTLASPMEVSASWPRALDWK